MSKKTTAQKQIDQFRQAARNAECDEDESAFEDKLRRIAQQKPEKEKTPDK